MEPLEIRLDFMGPGGRREWRSVSVTPRTPGHDQALAVGLLFAKGLLRSADEVSAVEHCGVAPAKDGAVRVVLRDGVAADRPEGNSAFQDLHRYEGGPFVPSQLLQQLPERLRQKQEVPAAGGLRAAALFDVAGAVVSVRQDVASHNAVDKVIGEALLQGRLPLTQSMLLVNDRAGLELVERAAAAGIPILAASGAPSSLALQLATDCNLTLLGFVKERRFNIFSGTWRVVPDGPPKDP